MTQIPELKEGFYHREEKTVGGPDPTVVVTWKLYGTKMDHSYLEFSKFQMVYTGKIINDGGAPTPMSGELAKSLHDWLEELWDRANQTPEERAAAEAYAARV